MSKILRCQECNDRTEHRIYKQNLYKYEGERVKVCKYCGSLRTENHKKVREANLYHIKKMKKVRNIDD
jgi:hypothetical protein